MLEEIRIMAKDIKERIHYIRKVSNFVELSDEEKRLSKTSQPLLVG